MKLLKINKVDISLKQLIDLDASNGDIDRVDNIRNGQILTAYVNPERTDQFRFKYITDILVAGSGITFVTTNGITTISSTGGGGGGIYTVTNGLTESPANNFKLGGSLTETTTIDGASNAYSLSLIDLYAFDLATEQKALFSANDGTKLAQFNLYPQADSTNWAYDDGAGGYTAIEMTGVKMYIQTPNYASKANGDVLTLIDNGSGQVEFQTPTTTTGDSLSPLLLMGG